MTITPIASLVTIVRNFASKLPDDYGWQEVLALSDHHIEEFIRDAHCTNGVDALVEATRVAKSFNED